MVSSTVGGYSMLMIGVGSFICLHQSWSKLYMANFFGFFFLFGVAGAKGNRGQLVAFGVPIFSVGERLGGGGGG